MKNWKEIEIPSSGKNNWAYGAYTLAFVVSDKGNFILKGFLKEVKDYLSNKEQKGLRYIVKYTLWNNKEHRSIYATSNSNLSVGRDEKTHRFYIKSWSWTGSNINIRLKRLPKKWCSLYEQLL